MKLSQLTEQSVWVGDPKQAIYVFRGFDPELVSAIFKKIAAGDKQANLITQLLKYSWRSRKDLVDLVNNMFPEAMKDQLEDMHVSRHDILGDDENDDQANRKGLKKWVQDTFGNAETCTVAARDTVPLIPVRANANETLNRIAVNPGISATAQTGAGIKPNGSIILHTMFTS